MFPSLVKCLQSKIGHCIGSLLLLFCVFDNVPHAIWLLYRDDIVCVDGAYFFVDTLYFGKPDIASLVVHHSTVPTVSQFDTHTLFDIVSLHCYKFPMVMKKQIHTQMQNRAKHIHIALIISSCIYDRRKAMVWL